MKYIKKFNEGKITNWFRNISIKSKCDYLGLKNYTINDNGTVDVSGNLNISRKVLKTIPIQFGVVTGNFDCSYNQLTSLKGCVKKVNGTLHCDNNNLTTLKGGPIEVIRHYNCSHNKNLISLEFSSKSIGGTLSCYKCPIYNIYSLFVVYPNDNKNYKRYQDSLDYNYLRGTNIIKLRFQEALEEIGKEAPNSIEGYTYI